MTKQIRLYSTGLHIHNLNNLVEVEKVITPELPSVPTYAYYIHGDKIKFSDLGSYSMIYPTKHRTEY